MSRKLCAAMYAAVQDDPLQFLKHHFKITPQDTSSRIEQTFATIMSGCPELRLDTEAAARDFVRDGTVAQELQRAAAFTASEFV